MKNYTYMLDTNTCIYAINNHPEHVAKKLKQAGERACCISSIVTCELAFGIEKSASPNKAKNQIRLQAFLSLFDIVSFDDTCMWHYAKLRHQLQQTGNVIGSLDMLIAAHALAIDTTLVTNNIKEFARVEALKLENWV